MNQFQFPDQTPQNFGKDISNTLYVFLAIFQLTLFNHSFATPKNPSMITLPKVLVTLILATSFVVADFHLMAIENTYITCPSGVYSNSC